MKTPLVYITFAYILYIIVTTSIDGCLSAKDKNSNTDRIPVKIIGLVASEPGISGSSIAFDLKDIILKRDGRTAKIGGCMRVFAPSDATNVEYGDKVEISGKYSSSSDGPGNPGQFDYGEYLKDRGYRGIMAVNYPSDGNLKVLEKGKGNPFVSFSIKVKARIIQTFKDTLPLPYSVLFGSVVFGLKASPVPDDIQNNFRRSGVIHVLVASGQQVSILSGICLFACRTLGVPAALMFLCASSVNWSFAVMAGLGASILRAAIMSQVAITGIVLEKEGDFYNTLALSALVLLIMNPHNLYDVGFQLSYMATFALVWAAPVFKSIFSRVMPGMLAGVLSVAVAPILATTPISVYHFSQLSLIAVLSNMIVVPLSELLTSIGFISAAVGFLFPFVSRLINGFAYIALFIMERSVAFFSSIPGSCINVVAPNLILVFLYYILLIFLLENVKMRSTDEKTKK